MAHHDDHDDLKPTFAEGYKVSQKKTADELAKLDANDESLARWKASLGLGPGGAAHAEASGPKVTVIALVLTSPTLPPGKRIALNLDSTGKVKDPVVITIKEGVEYNVGIIFKVNHSIISGVRYMQVVRRAGIKVDKLEQMLGSYAPAPTGEPYTKNFDPEEAPSGILARSGEFTVKSRVVDDDGEVYADFEWKFKIAKEW